MKDFWGKSKAYYAIKLIEKYRPDYVGFSGGKDSQTVLRLMEISGVPHEAHYNRAMEPPEVVMFIKENYPQVKRHLPEKNIWKLIVENGMPPLRTMKWCCRLLKHSGEDKIRVLGLRKQESPKRRKNRSMLDDDKNPKIINPIWEWSADDVWNFLKQEKINHCCLYDPPFNFKRIGCVMCPESGAKRMRQDAARWPKIAAAYRRACVRAYDPKIATTWKDGNEMYEWWLTGKAHKETPWF